MQQLKKHDERYTNTEIVRPSTASAFFSSIRRGRSRGGGVAFSGKCLATSNSCACHLSSGLPPPGGEARARVPPFLAAEVPSSVPSNGASQKAIVRASPSAAAMGAHAFGLIASGQGIGCGDRRAAFIYRRPPEACRIVPVSEAEIGRES
nr:unnamed protein product [Digitaria exilis]